MEAGGGVVSSGKADAGVDHVEDGTEDGDHAEEAKGALHGVDGATDAQSMRIDHADGVASGVGEPVHAFLGGVGVEETADAGMVIPVPHVHEAVGVGLVAEEAGEEEGRVVEGTVQVDAVVDLAPRSVADALDDGGGIVGEGECAAGGIVVVAGGGSAAADFVEQAEAPDVAGGDAVFGADEDFGEFGADVVGKGVGVAVVGHADALAVGIVGVGAALGGGEAVAGIVGVGDEIFAMDGGTLRHVAVGVMGDGLAVPGGELVVGVVGHGTDGRGIGAAGAFGGQFVAPCHFVAGVVAVFMDEDELHAGAVFFDDFGSPGGIVFDFADGLVGTGDFFEASVLVPFVAGGAGVCGGGKGDMARTYRGNSHCEENQQL